MGFLSQDPQEEHLRNLKSYTMLRFTCPSPTRRQPIQLKPKVKKAGGSGTSFNTHPGSCWNTLWGQRMTGHLLSLCCTLGHQDLTEGASTCVWHPHFCSCCQGAPVHCLGLVASGAYAPGSHRTVTNEERDFQRLPPAPKGTARNNRPGDLSFCDRGLFANHHDCARCRFFALFL